MAVSVCQTLVSRDKQSRSMSEQQNNGKRGFTKHNATSKLVGGITTTMSQDKYETLAIKIIIPPKPRGMNAGPCSAIHDDNNDGETVVSTFPVIHSESRMNMDQNNNNRRGGPNSSESNIDMKRLIGQEENLASSKLPFVWKLYEMLEDVEINGQEDIVSWIDNGRGFKVHNMQTFVDDIIPRYFRQSKYKSFQRQLYFYDFQRVASGPDAGSYQHPKFVKGVKTLCLSMMPKKTSRRRCSKNKELTSPEPEIMVSSHEIVMTTNESRTTSKIFESSSKDRRTYDDDNRTMRSHASRFVHPPPPQDRTSYSNTDFRRHHGEERRPSSSNFGDGDTVCVFGGRPFHFLEVTFDDIYPPNPTPPTTGSRALPPQGDDV